MALIKCEKCGQKMSDKAQVCPHCGKPNTLLSNNASRSATSMLVWGILGYIVLSLVFVPIRIMLYDSSYGNTYMLLEIDQSVRYWFMFVAIVASVLVAKSKRERLLFPLWAIAVMEILQMASYWVGMIGEFYTSNALITTKWIFTFLGEIGVITFAAKKHEGLEYDAVPSGKKESSSVVMPLLLGVIAYIVLAVPLNMHMLHEIKVSGQWWSIEIASILFMLVPIFICVLIAKTRYDRQLCALLVIAAMILITNFVFYMLVFYWVITDKTIDFTSNTYLYTLLTSRTLFMLCIVVFAAMRRKKYFAKMGNIKPL